uniref:Uncharacterized protein n=1 Tax=Chromera velia CCMP2878 TaxID=1169474 RepID=A0A0G4HKX6_9ALVE|eukprot:Cvel_7265.t1-p1 / transcript=Cvel_7265.t1 / gene=Cvel_7265 / organism=Chromera_velia_CCMP2878 / gene_product=hypothetical protein / transcript_product=hypothetical protein / location=Cvel_scaffold375:57143-61397(-) / protein_length=222 / sequence_SO=supercontig / SO=protein_coding / is_pseudo=false
MADDAPSFGIEEYRVPYHGVPIRYQEAVFPKEKKKDRISQLQKKAAWTPGPGTYIKHTLWGTAEKKPGPSFGKSHRTAGKPNGVPGPGAFKPQLAAGLVFDRTLGGPCSKGAKKTYVENSAHRSKSTPAPNHYKNINKQWPHVGCPHIILRTNGTGKYKGRALSYPNDIPGADFFSRTVKLHSYKPGPATYTNNDISRVTRGTKYNQVYRTEAPIHPLNGTM